MLHKCGTGKAAGLCPVSFGLALGFTLALAALVCSIWAMKYGAPATLAAHMLVPANFTDVGVNTLYAFFKGLIFGFVVAFFYDWILSCCNKKCGNNNSGCCDNNDKMAGK